MMAKSEEIITSPEEDIEMWEDILKEKEKMAKMRSEEEVRVYLEYLKSIKKPCSFDSGMIQALEWVLSDGKDNS